jgi:mono/diheme cytochrome c family protein
MRGQNEYKIHNEPHSGPIAAWLKAFLLLVGIVILVTVTAFLWIGSRGISARAEPGPIETAVARTMRRLAIPRGDRDRVNPVQPTAEVIAEGMAHYADHCAVCHANDGSGDTEMGMGLYPKAPDMRQAATQSMTDGELFYIIENGVRLTGMPAWGTGTPEGEEASWHLVHFIRQLPKLTEDQIEEMKRLTPRSRREIEQEIEEEEFLQGGEVPSSQPPGTHEH